MKTILIIISITLLSCNKVEKKKETIIVKPAFNRHGLNRCDAG